MQNITENITENITGFILAAGLGTRLRPLTNDRPKALVELLGRPLLAWAIDYMVSAGIRRIVVNAHHFAPQIVDFIQKYQQNCPAELFVSDESEQLLDTGGAILKAMPLLFAAHTEDVLIYNADIHTNLIIKALYHTHKEKKAMATLAVQARDTSRSFLFSPDLQLVGWQNSPPLIQRWARDCAEPQSLAFSGVHLLSAEAFAFLPTHNRIFSVVDWYLELAKVADLQGHRHDGDVWFDVGKPAQLQAAADFLRAI
jgi:NDP-sugar pyrophosphorylase family protein